MSSEINLDWSDFKNYVDTNLVPFKQISSPSEYTLYLSDQSLTAICLLPKDGGSDQTDYENNYQSRANRRFNYYSAAVSIRQTAATGAGGTVWAMRNAANSTRKVVIEEIDLLINFDATTPITPALLRYGISGFGSATPTTGSAVSACALDSSNPATQVTDIRSLDTGLSTTGVVFGNTFAIFGSPAVSGSTNLFSYKGPQIILAAGEGLCIRLAVAAVIGQGLTGLIAWSER